MEEEEPSSSNSLLLESEEKPPEDVFSDISELEATIKSRKQVDPHSATRYLQCMAALCKSEEGKEVLAKYKLAKRFIGLVLYPLLTNDKDDLSGKKKLLDTAIELYKELDNELLTDLHALRAEHFNDHESYVTAMLALEKTEAIELAARLNRLEDVALLFGLSSLEHSDLPWPTNAFIAYIKNNTLWRQLLAKLSKQSDTDRLACMSVKFAAIEGFLEFKLQLSIEISKFDKALALPLVHSACLATEQELQGLPVSIWSSLCQLLNKYKPTFLNKYKPTGSAYSVPSLDLDRSEFLRFVLTAEELSLAAPKYLEAIQSTTTSGYLAYDGKAFRLGPALLGGPSGHLADTASLSSTEIPKGRSPSMEIHDLKSRHSELVSKAKTESGADIFNLHKTVFVIDTNVLIAQEDFLESLLHLEASVYIPVIVLEELVNLSDHPVPEKASRARAALAWLDETYAPNQLAHKVTLRSLFASGKHVAGFWTKHESESLGTRTNDDLILKMCQMLAKKEVKGGERLRPVLVSEDVNMRLKAAALRLLAVDINGFTRASFVLSD